MLDCGGHEDGATEARTVAAGPFGLRETLAGATEGATHDLVAGVLAH